MNIPNHFEYDDSVVKMVPVSTHKHKRGRILLIFDCETHLEHDSKQAYDWLKLGALLEVSYAVTGDIVEAATHEFFTVQQLHDILSTLLYKHRKIELVAHNASFDLQVGNVMQWLNDNSLKVVFYYSQQTSIIIRAKDAKRSITITDSMNLFPMSLQQLGLSIGVHKGEIDFETCSEYELMQYCIQDCYVVAKGIESLHKTTYSTWGLRPQLTLASTAMRVYHMYDVSHKLSPHLNPKIHRMEFLAYYGGRVEVFRQGVFNNQTLYKLDVNSLYPSVMYSGQFPTKLNTQLHNVKRKVLSEILEKNIGLADLTISVDKPQFPYRHQSGVQYPTGTFRTFLCGDELKQANVMDCIDDIHTLFIYDSDYIFREYVDNIYELKKQAAIQNNNGKREVYKRLLNSLYGKFAQLGYTSREVRNDTNQQYGQGKIVNMQTGLVVPYKVIDSRKYLLTHDRITRTTMPIISACVTSAARQLMWKYFMIAGLDNCYYSDTDSIICNQIGLDHLRPYIHDTKLGYLKLEESDNNLEILGRKSYFWGDKRTTKGVPKKADENKHRNYLWRSYRNLSTGLFNSDKSLPFVFWQTRRLRPTLPEGYTLQGDKVVNPHY